MELGIALGRTNEFRKAILEFQKIKHITPSPAPRYFCAYALYRLEAMDEARALIAKARPHTSKPRGRRPAIDVSELAALP